MIVQLMWKEWREHRWKLAAMGMMVASVLALLAWFTPKGEVDWRTLQDYKAIMVIASWVAPIWVGAWTATSERARGDGNDSGRNAGARGWMMFAVKSFWGLVVLLLPMALAAACFGELARENGRWGHLGHSDDHDDDVFDVRGIFGGEKDGGIGGDCGIGGGFGDFVMVDCSVHSP